MFILLLKKVLDWLIGTRETAWVGTNEESGELLRLLVHLSVETHTLLVTNCGCIYSFELLDFPFEFALFPRPEPKSKN